MAKYDGEITFLMVFEITFWQALKLRLAGKGYEAMARIFYEQIIEDMKARKQKNEPNA